MDDESSLQGSSSTNLESAEGATPPPQPPPTPPHAAAGVDDFHLHPDDGSAHSHSDSSSDSSDGSGSRSNSASDSEQHSEQVNFHDRHADSEDEEWVLQQLLHHSLDGDRTRPEDSDQRISCPRCFVTLSFQSQAHVRYAGQYRALFVRNCHVNHGHRCTANISTTPNSTKTNNQATSVKHDRDVFHDVICNLCGTRVGVHESDSGVYHFCNVICSTT